MLFAQNRGGVHFDFYFELFFYVFILICFVDIKNNF
jgi:hypothetical protein